MTIKKSKISKTKINAIDLFCGVGGLTKGLEKSGIKVNLGVDIDPVCNFPYSANNSGVFLEKSINKLSGSDIEGFFEDGAI